MCFIVWGVSTLCGGCHLRLANVERRALTVRGPMGNLRKPNKLGFIINSASNLPAIGPHLLLNIILRLCCYLVGDLDGLARKCRKVK